MKRIFCLLLLLFLLPLPGARGEAAGEDPVIAQAQQSVVHLYGMGTDPETGRRSRWTGTGFAVGIAGEESDIYLTNWHVATGSGSYADGQVELWLLLDDAQFDSRHRPVEGSAVKCRVLITTDGYPDVAVIQALSPEGSRKALPLRPSGEVPKGAAVTALGFPGLDATRQGADSGPEDVQVSSGVVREHLTMHSAGDSQTIIHTAAIRHGFSGGPLLDSRGAVAAQNTYGFEADVSTELFCAVYIDYGMELLDRLNLPYTVSHGTEGITALMAALLHRPDLPPEAAWTLLALDAGAVLIVGLALLKAVRQIPGQIRKIRKKEEELHED